MTPTGEKAMRGDTRTPSDGLFALALAGTPKIKAIAKAMARTPDKDLRFMSDLPRLIVDRCGVSCDTSRNENPILDPLAYNLASG
jgi:hypothetical protein